MKASEVAARGLVVARGNASPGLELVDQALDGVPLLVEVGVVADRTAAPGALLPPTGGLVPLLRDDRLDAALPQVGPVASGRIGLMGSERRR